MSEQKIDKVALENEWSDRLMGNDRLWKGHHTKHRLYATRGTTFVAYTIQNGEPVLQDIFRVIEAFIGMDRGVGISFISEKTKFPFNLDNTPKLFPGSTVYGWLPAFLDIRYTPQDYDKVDSPYILSLPLCIKSQYKAGSLVEGAQYLTHAKIFRLNWPDVPFTI